MKTLCSHRDPRLAALSAEIAEQVAAWEAVNGKVKTLPLRVVEEKHPAFSIGRKSDKKIRVEGPL